MSSSVTATSRAWLFNAMATVVLWGIWGAFSGLSPQHGFPETLVYCVWALTMIPPALVVLAQAKWKLDVNPRAVAHGLAVGALGAGGQMVLFYAVTRGPAYLIFPVISLSPVRLGAIGIVLALLALPTFDFAPGGDAAGGSWLWMALIVMACWGLQAYFMKSANRIMSGESIFFYMMITGLALVPVALWLTDFSRPINFGVDGPLLAAGIQFLNAIGALTLVFAFRYGKAIIVAPLTNAGAPLATAIISLVALGVMPGSIKLVGIVLALTASLMLAFEPDSSAETKSA
jgi:drug/metabolite transporter (DMT)-like permease